MTTKYKIDFGNGTVLEANDVRRSDNSLTDEYAIKRERGLWLLSRGDLKFIGAKVIEIKVENIKMKRMMKSNVYVDNILQGNIFFSSNL